MIAPRASPRIDHAAAARAIDDFVRALGHGSDPALAGTGRRVAALWSDELLDGYGCDVDALIADAVPVFEGDSLVVVESIATHVVCPHHLTIATGVSTVGYRPVDRVLGFGAVAALVDAYAHRFALQEDVGAAIARALVDKLGASGAACAMRLRHGCLALHGPKQRSSRVLTLATAGAPSESDVAIVSASLRRRSRP
ncbi:MAG: GTP cyclohydrolase I [Polyangiales bacterium]